MNAPRRFSWANAFSLAAPLAAYVLLALVVRPWGDYPINDDWIYARIARKFAETGKFIFDHDTGAAFIGQGILAAGVIRVLGFSHTHLRELSMVTGGVMLCLLWELLSYGGVRPLVKAFALLTMVGNPIFGALSLSFLTDIYGYTVALLGAALWFAGRREGAQEPVVSWPGAILGGLVVGASFWVRQYCVLLYPAMLGATVFQVWRADGFGRLRVSLGRLTASGLVFAAVIATYFPFARYRAVVPMSDFHDRLTHLWRPLHPGVPLLEAGIALTYMTAFLFPLLALFPLKGLGRKLLPGGAALVAIGALTAVILLGVPPQRDLYPRFPYLANFIYNAGVGAILLPDVLTLPLRPQWPGWVWMAIEWLLVLGGALWAAVLLASRELIGKRKNPRGSEMLWLAILFACGSLAVTTVVDGLGAFDRYYLPELLSLLLATGVALSDVWPAAGLKSWRTLRFAAALLPMALFTTAGLHDFFRWNDIRWSLFHEAVDRGISPANIQGGYEINGWANFDFFLSKTEPTGCIGPCSCAGGYYCLDDSYRIGMNVYGDYEPIASGQPDYWLAKGPPIVLSRRRH